ncbi:MAG: DUF134 domain-containing protein [Candidatus Lokiarchaeota archaeon]|nr:DUF134 domain-containing protein [Candidatus Lokiarchaeota archaeon]
MTRPRKTKIVHGAPIPASRAIFKPAGIPLNVVPVNNITFEEYEAMRLVDWRSKSQFEAATMMGVSQPSISRLLTTGRQKVMDALVMGKAIRISGGDFRLAFRGFGCLSCDHKWEIGESDSLAPEKCPKCESNDIYSLKKEV